MIPKAAPPARRPETRSASPLPEPRDIRSSHLDVISRGWLVEGARRILSTAALVSLDVAGLALGLMAALVLRTLLYGDIVYWSLLWKTGPAEWLPFLAPVTALVFLRAGLYSVRERRGAHGRCCGVRQTGR